MSGLHLERLGPVMQPEPENPMEVEGVLHPAAIRGPDGQLYLFPRVVAHGNHSRIAIARVLWLRRCAPTLLAPNTRIVRQRTQELHERHAIMSRRLVRESGGDRSGRTP